MFGKMMMILATVAILCSFAVTARADGSLAARGEVHLSTYLVNGAGQSTGKAEYHEVWSGKVGMQGLLVRLIDEKPGSDVPVSVNGRFVGRVRIGVDGKGELTLKHTYRVGSKATAFPRLRAGDTIKAGSSVGTFEK